MRKPIMHRRTANFADVIRENMEKDPALAAGVAEAATKAERLETIYKKLVAAGANENDLSELIDAAIDDADLNY